MCAQFGLRNARQEAPHAGIFLSILSPFSSFKKDCFIYTGPSYPRLKNLSIMYLYIDKKKKAGWNYPSNTNTPL